MRVFLTGERRFMKRIKHKYSLFQKVGRKWEQISVLKWNSRASAIEAYKNTMLVYSQYAVRAVK